jgi:hypothetical protein
MKGDTVSNAVRTSPCWLRKERGPFKDEAVFSEVAREMRGLEKKRLVRVDCYSFSCLARKGPGADAHFLLGPIAEGVWGSGFGQQLFDLLIADLAYKLRVP